MADLIGIFKKLGKLKDLRTNKKTDLVSSINEVNDKANSSVSSVEAGLNYNTIKITKNDGTTENILIKVQGGSDSINVFKTAQHGGSFIATEDTDTFTIEGIDSTKDVQVIYKNFFLVPNVDYTVNKETGEIGLGFALEKDEVIYYLITDTSFDYNELNNLPNIGDLASLKTSSKEIVGGINEVLEKEKSNEEQINVCTSELTKKTNCLVTYLNASAGANSLETTTESSVLVVLSKEYNSILYEVLQDNFAYVIQYFYGSISSTSNRIQIAFGYGANNIAFRRYRNGWSAWERVVTATMLQSVLDAQNL